MCVCVCDRILFFQTAWQDHVDRQPTQVESTQLMRVVPFKKKRSPRLHISTIQMQIIQCSFGMIELAAQTIECIRVAC